MLDSIYYNRDLVPIPVKVIKKRRSKVIVKTASNDQFEVPAHRIIPMLPTIKQNLLNWKECPKPSHYLSVLEYLVANKFDFSLFQRHDLSRICGKVSREKRVDVWIGKAQTRHYPASLIADCCCQVKSLQTPKS